MPNSATTISRKEVTFGAGSGVSGKAILSFDANRFMSAFDRNMTLSRYSPVLQKKIGAEYQNNIVISGKFRTNFSSEDSSGSSGFSFIQVRKNSSGKASAYTGYGIAWRPSIPNAEGSVAIKSVAPGAEEGYYDIEAMEELGADVGYIFLAHVDGSGKRLYIPIQYINYDAGVYTGCYCPGVVPATEDTLCAAPPNVFIVDSNAFEGDSYSANYISDPLTGLGYLQAAHAIITQDTDYYFEMQIDEGNKIEFSMGGEPGALTKIIESGSATPVSEYAGSDDADSFGISVYDTAGYQWWYDDLRISKLSGEHAILYCEFSVIDMPDILQVEMSGFAEDSGGNSIIMSVWNETETRWDEILAAAPGEATPMVSNMISKSECAVGGKIIIRVTTGDESASGAPSIIDVDYIRLVASRIPGLHLGGCIDVYVDDPSATLKSETKTIDAISGALAEISGLPNISSIKIDATELLYSKDYMIYYGNPSLYNSVYSKATIKFKDEYKGKDAVIDYWESSVVSGAQSILNDDEHRPLSVNVAVKHKAIHEIRVTPTDSNTHDTVEAYLNTLGYENGEKKIVYTDLYKYMYAVLGVYVDLSLTIRSLNKGKIAHRHLSLPGHEYAINEIDTFRLI